jgi:hypothetical protein
MSLEYEEKDDLISNKILYQKGQDLMKRRLPMPLDLPVRVTKKSTVEP